jgi:hypothetical protein
MERTRHDGQGHAGKRSLNLSTISAAQASGVADDVSTVTS